MRSEEQYITNVYKKLQHQLYEKLCKFKTVYT